MSRATKAALDPTSRAAWTNAEAVDAFRDQQLEEAERLDGEIRTLVKDEGRSRYQLCLRLGRMRSEGLWKVLNYRSFVRYALEAKAAGSSREARQWADIADRLPELPALDAVFASGAAPPSVIRELVPVATTETDAALARQAVAMTVADACNEARRLRGEAPVARLSVELPLETKALLVGVVVAELSERLGTPVSVSEALVHLVDLYLAERAGRPAQAPAEGPAQASAEGPAQVSARLLPSPRAQLHPGKCVKCETHQLRGPDGWIALSPTMAAMNECDAEVVDAHGRVLRTIPERIRRLVFARDGMVCAVPGCGATRGLNFHHEAPAGWRDVGADPEHLCLLCAAHHRQRHEGWLTIEGTTSTGRRFYGYGGRELVAKSAAPAAEVAHVGNVGPSEVDDVAERSVAGSAGRAEVAHVGSSDPAAVMATPSTKEVDELAERTLRALELKKSAACAAIQRVRARTAEPLTVEELVTLALRGLPSG